MKGSRHLNLVAYQLDKGNPVFLWDCPPNNTTKNNKDNKQHKIKTTYYKQNTNKDKATEQQ